MIQPGGFLVWPLSELSVPRTYVLRLTKYQPQVDTQNVYFFKALASVVQTIKYLLNNYLPFCFRME